MASRTEDKPTNDDIEIYCKHCGGCGYIGCDGIRAFLKAHVAGKTNCLNEVQFIEEIITYVEMYDEQQEDGGEQ